ncbi:MAG: hypothetical protein ABEJ58_09340 [Halodesulfurarchaeum sp.]
MVWLVEQLVEVISLFGQVATNDPMAPLLLLVSAALMGTAMGVFGFLAFGGIVSALGHH